jgi:hypothetical protein
LNPTLSKKKGGQFGIGIPLCTDSVNRFLEVNSRELPLLCYHVNG